MADHLRPTAGSVSVTPEYFETLGVAPDLFLGGLRPDQRSGVYAPLAQKPRPSVRMVIRTRGEPAAIAPFVRAQVAALDSSLPIDRALTMRQVLDSETWAVGRFGPLFAAFGVAALSLAAVGLYGVVAFSTSQRTHEIGIRIALGASVRDVVSLVMRQGFSQLGIGVTPGMALGLGFSRMVASWFFGLGSYDPVTVVTVLAVMLTTTVLACLTPARHAVRISPATALRDQQVPSWCGIVTTHARVSCRRATVDEVDVVGGSRSPVHRAGHVAEEEKVSQSSSLRPRRDRRVAAQRNANASLEVLAPRVASDRTEGGEHRHVQQLGRPGDVRLLEPRERFIRDATFGQRRGHVDRIRPPNARAFDGAVGDGPLRRAGSRRAERPLEDRPELGVVRERLFEFRQRVLVSTLFPQGVADHPVSEPE